MTANQINYWKVMEEKRHNVAVEAETARYNKTVNLQNQAIIEENKRHNLESELIGLKQAAAALTSAGAAMLQARTREAELVESQRVNSANIARQDALAQAQIQEYASVVTLNEAKTETQRMQTGLTAAQTSTQIAQTGLVYAQTLTEQKRPANITSSTVLNYAKSVQAGVDAAGDILGLVTGTSSIKDLVS